MGCKGPLEFDSVCVVFGLMLGLCFGGVWTVFDWMIIDNAWIMFWLWLDSVGGIGTAGGMFPH